MKRSNYKYVFVACLLVLLASCGVNAPGATKGSGDGMVQIFSKGKDSLLCYGGPLQYSPKGNDDAFSIDHTYLKVKGHSNLVVCNFSLISKDASFRPEKVTLALGEKHYELGTPEKMYAEGYGKKKYVYRYTFSVSDSLFYKWMQYEEPIITVNDKSFEGGKKYRKGSESIFRAFLFDLDFQ
jgi:hypothetical protein